MDRNAIVKALWQAKLARRLTATGYLIGRVLVRRAHSRTGQLWPSRATMAADVGCSEKTVSRAITALRGLGLLTWQRRRLPGHRRFTSNLYQLTAARPVRQVTKESICEESRAEMSRGLAAALDRLGRAMGCPAGQVAPWLPRGALTTHVAVKA